MRRWTWAVAAAAAVALGPEAALAEEPGAKIWRGRCQGCHGPDGAAQTKMGAAHKIPDFRSAKWQRAFADGDIRMVIAEGSPANPKMKPYGDLLSAEEIDSLVRFVRTLRQ